MVSAAGSTYSDTRPALFVESGMRPQAGLGTKHDVYVAHRVGQTAGLQQHAAGADT